MIFSKMLGSLNWNRIFCGKAEDVSKIHATNYHLYWLVIRMPLLNDSNPQYVKSSIIPQRSSSNSRGLFHTAHVENPWFPMEKTIAFSHGNHAMNDSHTQRLTHTHTRKNRVVSERQKAPGESFNRICSSFNQVAQYRDDDQHGFLVAAPSILNNLQKRPARSLAIIDSHGLMMLDANSCETTRCLLIYP